MNWVDLLGAAIDRKGLKVVAAEMGYARSSVCLARHGRYPGSTARIEARVAEVYGRVECPFLGHSLAADECQVFRQRPTPTNNRQSLKHWAACQGCPVHTEPKP